MTAIQRRAAAESLQRWLKRIRPLGLTHTLVEEVARDNGGVALLIRAYGVNTEPFQAMSPEETLEALDELYAMHDTHMVDLPQPDFSMLLSFRDKVRNYRRPQWAKEKPVSVEPPKVHTVPHKLSEEDKLLYVATHLMAPLMERYAPDASVDMAVEIAAKLIKGVKDAKQ